MFQQRFLLGVLMCVVAVRSVPLPDDGAYFLVDDMQIPSAGRRHANPLSAVSFTTKSFLWSLGQVNYYIETAETNTNNPASSFLTANDSRILQALAHWEERTCIRFTLCSTAAACATPYIRFISDLNSCNSPIGRWTTVNQINLAENCGLGAVIHEIGHSLGLSHEQSRNDRDQYIAVDMTQVAAGKEKNFAKTGNTGRDIGAYDYASIMHYGAGAFAKGSLPTIVTQQPLGQREGLSDGDVESIQFLYNECKPAYTAPLCIASRTPSLVPLIPHSKVFMVEFNAEWTASSSMTISYGQTTAPGASYSVASGTNVGDSTMSQVSFTPSVANAGNTYVLAATFTSTGAGGESTTCQVTVRVASSDLICFGKPSDAPDVCSGRGTCTSDVLAPCSCSGSYGGLECGGYASCPENLLFSFDDIDDMEWTNVVADTSFFLSGGASASIAPGKDFAWYSPTALSTFTWVTYNIAWPVGVEPAISINDGSGTSCLYFFVSVSQVTNGIDYFNIDWTPEPDTWYYVEHTIDPVAATMTIRIDGRVYLDAMDVSSSSCHKSGASGMVWFRGGWLDNVRMFCHSYVQMTGSLMNPTQADLVAGGLVLTLTIEGGVDNWVDSTATKEAVVQGMRAGMGGSTGWDALKDTMLKAASVSISGSVLTVGPLAAAPAFSESLTTRVKIALSGPMVSTGSLPLASDELSFSILGHCSKGIAFGYDDTAVPLPAGFLYNTDDFKEGIGALEVNITGRVQSLSLGSIKPRVVSFYGYVVDASAASSYSVVSLRLPGSSESIEVQSGIFNRFRLKVGGVVHPAAGLAESEKWYLHELAFDWSAMQVSLIVDGKAVIESVSLPPDTAGLDTARLYGFGAGSRFDSIMAPCADPLFVATPDCFSSAPSVAFHIYPGDGTLSVASDAVAVVPEAATDCSTATSCNLDACSSVSGTLSSLGLGVIWTATLSALSSSTRYRLCYFTAERSTWTLLSGSFMSCATTVAPGATPAPLTDAPATKAPATGAPRTTAPATAVPPTEIPATEAPSPAPPTGIPSTAAPPSEAPATAA
ncbi:Protein SpAN, partial [Diplonema papillatum]